MFCMKKAKFEPNHFCFMLRQLDLLLREWKNCRLEAKIEAKNIIYFYVRGLWLFKSSSCRLARINEKVRKCYLQRLSFRTKCLILQSVYFLCYNCLISIFFKRSNSLFEGSNCVLWFILDLPLRQTHNLLAQNIVIIWKTYISRTFMGLVKTTYWQIY